MKIHLELLFHFRCDQCDRWWSIADILPACLDTLPCPHCGHINSATEIECKGAVEANKNNAGSPIYVRIRDEQIDSSAELTPWWICDLDAEGRLVGIEILRSMAIAPPLAPPGKEG